jgi:hypothetical protein
MFSKKENEAIREKIEQLRKVKDGTLSPQELANLITKRRVNWIEEHLDEILKKYQGLSLPEQAHRIIFLEHMYINSNKSVPIRVSPKKLIIHSYNFCPYLEACNELELETAYVCKDIGEPAIQDMIKRINPSLRFGRNYSNIRPHNKYFCEEYIELAE